MPPKKLEQEPQRDSTVTPREQCRPERRGPHAARDLSSGRFMPRDPAEATTFEGER